MRWWDRRLNRTKKGATMPTRRLSDYYSFRLFVSFLLATALMFALLMAFVPSKSSGNIPPTGPIIEDATPSVPKQTVPPTCQDFAAETKANRIEGWRRILWEGLKTSGAPKEGIQCAINTGRVYAFDDAIEIGCRSGGAFHEVFMAEMNRHLIPCGFQMQRNNP